MKNFRCRIIISWMFLVAVSAGKMKFTRARRISKFHNAGKLPKHKNLVSTDSKIIEDDEILRSQHSNGIKYDVNKKINESGQSVRKTLKVREMKSVKCNKHDWDCARPSAQPSSFGTQMPTYPKDSNDSTAMPTPTLTTSPTLQPSENPTESPTSTPSITVTVQPSLVPSLSKTESPTENKSEIPSGFPIESESDAPSKLPTENPTYFGSVVPTSSLTTWKSEIPSSNISELPTSSPSDVPSQLPTSNRSDLPTVGASDVPSQLPTFVISIAPSVGPTLIGSSEPSVVPTIISSNAPTPIPSDILTSYPTDKPSVMSMQGSTVSPSILSSVTSSTSSINPTTQESKIPSAFPTIMTVPPSTVIISSDPTISQDDGGSDGSDGTAIVPIALPPFQMTIDLPSTENVTQKTLVLDELHNLTNSYLSDYIAQASAAEGYLFRSPLDLFYSANEDKSGDGRTRQLRQRGFTTQRELDSTSSNVTYEGIANFNGIPFPRKSVLEAWVNDAFTATDSRKNGTQIFVTYLQTHSSIEELREIESVTVVSDVDALTNNGFSSESSDGSGTDTIAIGNNKEEEEDRNESSILSGEEIVAIMSIGTVSIVLTVTLIGFLVKRHRRYPNRGRGPKSAEFLELVSNGSLSEYDSNLILISTTRSDGTDDASCAAVVSGSRDKILGSRRHSIETDETSLQAVVSGSRDLYRTSPTTAAALLTTLHEEPSISQIIRSSCNAMSYLNDQSQTQQSLNLASSSMTSGAEEYSMRSELTQESLLPYDERIDSIEIESDEGADADKNDEDEELAPVAYRSYLSDGEGSSEDEDLPLIPDKLESNRIHNSFDQHSQIFSDDISDVSSSDESSNGNSNSSSSSDDSDKSSRRGASEKPP